MQQNGDQHRPPLPRGAKHEILYRGRIQNLKAWCLELGLVLSTARKRWRRGVPVETIFMGVSNERWQRGPKKGLGKPQFTR